MIQPGGLTFLTLSLMTSIWSVVEFDDLPTSAVFVLFSLVVSKDVRETCGKYSFSGKLLGDTVYVCETI